MPYAAAAARVVAVRAQELIEHSQGVLDVSEIEGVHAMRVATRRLRAALEVFRPCFPRDEHRAALREVKAIADALGERRDRDVTIASLDHVAATLAAPDRPGIESLAHELRNEQGRANESLASFVEPARLEALYARLESLVAAAEELGGDAAPKPLASRQPRCALLSRNLSSSLLPPSRPNYRPLQNPRRGAGRSETKRAGAAIRKIPYKITRLLLGILQ